MVADDLNIIILFDKNISKGSWHSGNEIKINAENMN